MWVVTDEAMNSLLGGEFSNVVIVKQENKETPVKRLYSFQKTYLSYQGFRKFFRNHLQYIIEKICFIEDNSFVGSVIKYVVGLK